ncbi:methyltransferase domain-containing protein [Chitiniphilus purpureus]|uniref:Methyltransferase domain-containing protein n=1 Tax=Chitiniphilus purpureus TaxID=2981137 RepID=A0ABY6DNZ7_9NEIS|nr:methyltransferase domain-containing protein [Chitiniphilus sp. CD1]UXY16084.1 methyltransferase domain-containing protein [Chitiniphilus sp. CD1]
MSGPSLMLDTPELARHYEAVSVGRQFQAGLQLVAALRIRPGERVLDVGCGTGLLAEHVAGLVGPAGRVVGIDPLSLRIELARQHRREPGNLTFAVGNAYALDVFEPEAFDVVYLNAVLHWLADKPQALAQIRQVLRPGGRIGIATGSREHPGALQRVRHAVLSQPPYDAYPQARDGASARVDAAELGALLTAAGFDAVRIDVRPDTQVHADADAAIAFSQASSFGNFLGHLPEALRAGAREAIRVALDAQRQQAGVRQQGARLYAIALRA